MKKAFCFALWCWPLLAGAQNSYDWTGRQYNDEKEASVDRQVVLPPMPQTSDLVLLNPGSTPMKYFVDAKSLTVETVGIARYTMVIRSDSGATNTMYEGLQCGEAQYKVYAYARADGSWYEPKDPQWRPLRSDPVRLLLYRDILCPEAVSVLNTEEAVQALRAGFHPESLVGRNR